MKAFCNVADCNSLTLAAKKMNISQPTLSLQVQSLEKKYGIVLIKRNRKSFELTEEGRIIFTHARSIFSLGGRTGAEAGRAGSSRCLHPAIGYAPGAGPVMCRTQEMPNDR